jgi:flagellar protein FlbD
MIELTKVSGDKITVNAEEIETVESSHDTTITMKSGKKLLVMESSTIISELTIAYKKKCYAGLIDLQKETDLK